MAMLKYIADCQNGEFADDFGRWGDDGGSTPAEQEEEADEPTPIEVPQI